MKLISKLKLLVLLLIYANAFGQKNQFLFYHHLTGINDQWHKIVLDDMIFENLSKDLSDIRIYGINSKGDTIEVPYVIKLNEAKQVSEQLDFDLINKSSNEQGTFYTFQMPVAHTINQINLNFEEKNFDWLINLEGSQDMNDWFTLLEDYRILSISNQLTSYEFTKVRFSDSRYLYYRLFIKNRQEKTLIHANISYETTVEANYRIYEPRSTNIIYDRNTKETLIQIDLSEPVPVSFLQINITDTIDFYRPLYIQALTDSFYTDNGWKYNYSNISSGILSSFENNTFTFTSLITTRIKIGIVNNDNKPLRIAGVVVKGYIYEIIARFEEPAKYYLVYGNKNLLKPDYDIEIFKDRIPELISQVALGQMQRTDVSHPETQPFFSNILWLWAIILVIILILGFASFRLLR